ncbi:thioredoxin family protein [Ferrimonas marina]|uniref:Thiol-disulfide isomerase or thioredoxin n=1 Tax=Ferrimonas marina TaxID=299255 RepID=A0A1M5ZFI6_9GAMM|nr:thioredoxin family protein [Ferrimonas marina]SHI23016.1 Thiol-disulfide isomerase or thioredoxin [Ferrimonas marina]
MNTQNGARIGVLLGSLALLPMAAMAQPEMPLDHKKMLSQMAGQEQQAQAQGNPHDNPHGGAPMQDAVLTGELDSQQLIFELVPMGRAYLDYQVDAEALAPLANYQQQTQITAVIGTWCPSCQSSTPALIKIIKELDNPNIQARYLGVDRQGQGAGVDLATLGVSVLPTYIVYREGQEVGRIEGELEQPLEQSLAAMLR